MKTCSSLLLIGKLIFCIINTNSLVNSLNNSLLQYGITSGTTGDSDVSLDVNEKSTLSLHDRKPRVTKKHNSAKVLQEYHFPYRPKFPANEDIGLCQLEYFAFDPAKDAIGHGGFGQVFKAKHISSGRYYALKLIPAKSIKEKPKHVENEETIHRIQDSPFVAKLYCTARDYKTNDIYFVMELFSGGSLSSQIRQMYPLRKDAIIKYTAQILIALRSIHRKCIVYRDLKADNVMIDSMDNVRLIDFGLSVYDADNSVKNLAGTLEYIAPEIASKKAYGRAVDFYSAGILLHVMVTGRHPYRRRKDEDKAFFIKKIAEKQIKINPTGWVEADQVISILTTEDPAQRWRFMNNDFVAFKSLPFFKGFDWDYYDAYPNYMRHLA